MCGIAGVVGDFDQVEQVVSCMSEAQMHRGKESSCCWTSVYADYRIGLAHNRMKTIDVPMALRQPFDDRDTELVVMLDGEIFNFEGLRKELENHYRFSTGGMCEVISKAYDRWGVECFGRFEGYFAIAVYHRRSGELLLCRDRFGVKPLYYATHRGNLFFASEIKALFAGGIRPLLSAERWASYWVYSTYGNPCETFWEGVYQLPAGYLLRYNGYSIEESCWYEFEKEVARWGEESPESLSQVFREQMSCSVGYSLMGDMPRGLSLNGGLESALFLSLMRELGLARALKSFMHYRGRVQDSDVLWGAEMLSGTRLPMEQVRITKSMLLKELGHQEQWIEEPVDGAGMVAYSAFCQVVRKRGLSVLSGGWGLDLFWGSSALSGDRCTTLTPWETLSCDFRQLAQKPVYRHLFSSEKDNLRYCDLCYERIPHLLRMIDKIGMYHGVQIRHPFLNHRLVEIAFAFADDDSGSSRKKWFTEQISTPLLIEPVRLAPRRDVVAASTRESLPDGLKGWGDEVVRDLRHGYASHWFDQRRLEREWDDGESPLWSDPVRLWKLLSLCMQLKSVM